MLAITLGDPHSVSIELLSKLLRSPSLTCPRIPVVVIGSLWHWEDQCKRLKLPHPAMDFIKISDLNDAKQIKAGRVHFLDINTDKNLNRPAETLSSKERGLVALASLEVLRRFKPDEKFAVVTCPIDKSAMKDAGFAFDGHTEFFESIWNHHAVMLLAGPKLRVGLVTNHTALSQVPQLISEPLIKEKAHLLSKCLREVFNYSNPRIAVAALNPHAGDHGLFGSEDEAILGPAIASLKEERFQGKIEGPFPADTVFYQAYHGSFDAVLAMYHDQGLGPLKTVHFDDAINISGGLPHLRVSPCHGPAKDLFLKEKASLKSMQQALTIAINSLSQARK